MVASSPTQEQVDQVAATLAPDVVRIKITPDEDWDGDPANYFRVILSDDVFRSGRLGEVTTRVRETFDKIFGLWASDRIPYFRFRSESDQAKLRQASWE
jgi:hypothetical protein